MVNTLGGSHQLRLRDCHHCHALRPTLQTGDRTTPDTASELDTPTGLARRDRGRDLRIVERGQTKVTGRTLALAPQFVMERRPPARRLQTVPVIGVSAQLSTRHPRPSVFLQPFKGALRFVHHRHIMIQRYPMKPCPSCGAEYPTELTLCPLDRHPLDFVTPPPVPAVTPPWEKQPAGIAFDFSAIAPQIRRVRQNHLAALRVRPRHTFSKTALVAMARRVVTRFSFFQRDRPDH
jgi:hypothetical protein